MVEVLLLAGSSGHSELTDTEHVMNKSFISINGIPIVSYILSTLAQCPELKRILVVGPVEQLMPLAAPYQAEVIPETGSIAQNILAANREMATENYILLVTADIPLLTKEAIEAFLDKCRPFEEADFYYPIVTREANEAKFPEVIRTYVSLKEGVYTGGNIMLINPRVVEQGIPRVEKFIKFRKSPLKMVNILGMRFLFRFATHRLTVKELEESFSRLLGIRSRAVDCPYPEIGIDVDKVSDLELVRKILQVKC
jgi:GTP:adenosylcobinamide-phosphate guanylyltransferase